MEVEVEVKLRLPNESNHSRLKTLLSPFHIKTLTQQNIFFDSADASLSSHRAVLRFRFFEDAGVSRCIVALKARPTLVNGVSRVEEDEEEIGADVGRQCVADLSRLSLIGSRLLKRCREEFGIGDEMGFVCLGGFGNVREVFEWRGLKMEVDETKYEFGVCYEVECESDDPERVKRELEELLNENGIEYKYSEMSKFAVFRSGKLPYNPYVMGTSVVALKYKDGILMAADMGGSYGSTLRYKSVERVKPIEKHSLLGASGQLAKLGLAPFLCCTILLLLMTYIHSVVIASNLPKVTARFGLLAWLGVFLATSGLVMFYRCSRKDPGYMVMNGRDLQNIKDDERLLKIEMNNPALLAGNWSQLCATCKAASSVTNNGKLSGRSMGYDGENSHDPHADELHFNEEVQTDYGQENVGEVDDLSQDEAAAEAPWEKEGKSEKHQYSSKQDSLVESVLTLQSVQRALQSDEYKDEDFRRVNTALGPGLCVLDLTTMSEYESSAPVPPPFDPSQPSIPISYPIKSLKELASRSYFNSFHYPFNKSSVPLQQQEQEKERPRILVCHDLQGGYSDDKWVQGGKNPDAYAIWHWYLIDVFVYFSHSLITLPPPCWTNTAHLHGVKVLGTFITEWDEGKVICNDLLSTMESAHLYAELLAELAVALGFDGWLLNFEVVLDVGQIPNVIEFVSHLTQTMHSLLPGSLVIWYDSVTTDGELKWQDQLNEKNKPFFDNCDGIFVNYTWKEDYPKSSAAVAGDRKFDVYMGIDVFGRNTYGGGQWDTNVALDVLKKDNVSAAIFAPAWIYETKQPPDFQTAQNRWWALVEKSWGTVNLYPKRLPFYSNFDQGRGHHISVEGGEVSNAPWNNISSQGFQPLLEFKGDPTSETIEVLVDFGKASYSGGGNITFKGTLKANAEFTARIFQGEILLGEMPLYFTYSVKSEGDSLVGLSLQFSSTMNDKRMVLLAPGKTYQFLKESNKVIMPRQVNDPEMAGGWAIMESSIMMNGFALTEIHAVCYRRKQGENSEPRTESETYEQHSGNSNEYFAALGHISIKSSKESPYFPPSSAWVVEGHFIKWGSSSRDLKTLSLKIAWKLKDGKDSSFPKYNIYVKKLAKQTAENTDDGVGGIQEYLGVANVEAFYISELSVPSSASGLKFIIQACAIDGSCQRLDGSPYFLLDVEGS